MFSIAVTILALVFGRSVLAHVNRERRSLNEFIKHYEPLYYDQDTLIRSHQRVRRSLGADTSLELKFHAHGRHFPLVLKRDTETFADRFVPEGDSFSPGNIYRGHVSNDPGSKVHGFIYDDIFEGRIVTSQDEQFFIEPAKQYIKDPEFHSVIYNGKDVDYPYPHGPSCGIKKETRDWMRKIQESAKPPVDEPKSANENKYAKGRNKRATSNSLGDKTSCQLYVQADWTFTELFAKSKDRAMYLMTQYVQSADSVYKRTDFNQDGQPESISFVIARMTANTSADCQTNCPFKEPNLGVEVFLGLNSDMNHNDFCLAYIFAHRDFADGVLGLAWIAEKGSAAGGICERYRPIGSGVSRSLNTGIVTTLNYQKTVPGKVIYITLSHELGHNFGAKHDPTTAECAPGNSGNDGGNYIMYPSATSGSQSNNDQFSKCSKEFIWPVLESKSGNCFKKPSGPICGNKIVEENEDCDCGYEGECNDPCCVSKKTASDEGCKFTTKALTVLVGRCSPSQGPCCVKEQCKVVGASPKMKCSDATECAQESYCDGNKAQCPAPPPKPDIETVCSEGAKVCINGSCIGSICLKDKQQECQCSSKENFCDICCKNATQDTCRSRNIKQAPGSPCDNFLGYCDILNRCRKVDADGPLSRLKNFFFSQAALDNIVSWMKKYWWACVLIGLGLVLFMAGFIKLCSVHTPSNNPNMKAARPVTLPRSLSRRRRPTAPPATNMNHPPAYDEEPLPGYNTAIRDPGPPRGFKGPSHSRQQNFEMSGGYRY